MFDLATVSSLVTAGAAAAALLVAGMLVRTLRKPKPHRSRRLPKTVTHRCSMCQRTAPEDATHDWNIRGAVQRVCGRCHPFYKLRFGAAQHEDTATI